MSALQRKLQMSHLPPKFPIGMGGGTNQGSRPAKRRKDYCPVSWDQYFQKHDVVCLSDTDKFSLYESGDSGPALVFLHGGGFSALSWALLTKSISEQITCRCLAIDLRGHGNTTTSNDGDLSADTMVRDISAVVNKVYGEEISKVIVGHSMGGALAVHLCQQNLIPNVEGLVVIDVVEGTAIDALASMQSFLRGRPPMFKSLEAAIEWSIRSGQIRNAESAKVSMVGQLKRVDDSKPATEVLESAAPPGGTTDMISEEDEENEENGPPTIQQVSATQTSKATTAAQSGVPNVPYTWRIDLTQTEQYWRGWFEGLSSRFLSCPPAKMLLLADVNRLDRELTVGQMQGKFQMQVLPQSGHAVHEDVPDKVADALCTFLVRHRLAQPSHAFNRVFPSC